MDANIGTEIWRLVTNNNVQSYEPPPHSNYKIEIKKSVSVSDEIRVEDRYTASSETLNLSDYGAKSEYAGQSEYAGKSEYSVDLIMFEKAINVGIEEMSAAGERITSSCFIGGL